MLFFDIMTYARRQELGAVLVMLAGTLVLFAGFYIGIVNELGLCIYGAVMLLVFPVVPILFCVITVAILLMGTAIGCFSRSASRKFFRRIGNITDPLFKWFEKHCV